MPRSVRALGRLFRSCLDHWFARGRDRFAGPCRLRLECLEDRLVPASLGQSGTTLTITLDSAGEQLSIAATTQGAISLTSTATFSGSLNGSAGFTGFGHSSGSLGTCGIAVININDTSGIHGGSVVFADSGSNIYTQAFSVNLSDSQSGNIAFSGTSSFRGGDVTADTNGGAVTFAAGSAIDFPGTGNLTLSAGASASLDLGSITLTGEGSLSVSAAGTIDQLSGATISAGTATFTITANSGDILLGGTSGSTAVDGGGLGPNLFTGGVMPCTAFRQRDA